MPRMPFEHKLRVTEMQLPVWLRQRYSDATHFEVQLNVPILENLTQHIMTCSVNFVT